MWDLPSGAMAKTLNSQCRGQGPGVPTLEGEPDLTVTTKTRCTQINYVIKKNFIAWQRNKDILFYFTQNSASVI